MNLFSGTPNPFGGLSNEQELVKACPKQFRDPSNPWTRYTSLTFLMGLTFFVGTDLISNWKWKGEDKAICKKQLACWRGLLGGWSLKHEDKEAVAGWMLSEMLVEVPQRVKPKQNKDK